MTTKNQGIIAAGVIMFFLATFFPPWIYTHDRNGSYGGHAHRPAGYYCILAPPSPKSTSPDDGVSLDMARLVLEWVCILVTAGAVRFLLSAGLPDAPVPTKAKKHNLFFSEIKWIMLGVIGASLVYAIIIKVFTPKFIPPKPEDAQAVPTWENTKPRK